MMRNAGIIHYALFWNGNSGLQCAYFVNNDLQSASMNRRFLNIIHKMVQILQQRGTVKTREPQTWGPSVNSIADSLNLNLFTFRRYQIIFHWKQTKEKLGNALKAWRKSRDKTKIGKEIIWQRVNKYLLKSLAHEIVLRHEK